MVRKLTHEPLTLAYLTKRATRAVAAGYQPPKWAKFSAKCIRAGLKVTLYEARQTVSKYLTISDGTKTFKVRFSNHRPIKAKELKGDCDFFVGVSNTATTNTDQAIEAAESFFNVKLGEDK